MTKHKFLSLLQERLSGLPQDDVEERLNFYSEMIEDRMEEGLSEEEAVSAIGSVDVITAQIVADIPLAKIAKEKIKSKRRLNAWEVVLLVLGSPIWLSLMMAAFAVLLSLYAVLWSVVISLWAAFGAVVAYSVGGIIAGFGLAFGGKRLTGVAVIGTGIFCAGLAIFLFYGCRTVSKGIFLLAKKILLWVKSCFMKKEDA